MHLTHLSFLFDRLLMNSLENKKTPTMIGGCLTVSFPNRLVLALYDVKATALATLRKTLNRQFLLYPLASLDIFGQQPVFI